MQTTAPEIIPPRALHAIAVTKQRRDNEAMVAMAERVAGDPNTDVNKLAAVLDVLRKLREEAREIEFYEAFYALEPKLPRIKKNNLVEYPVDKNKPDGPKKKAFKFACWEDVDDAIRDLLREHGFWLEWDTTQRVGDGGGLIVIGTLRHVSGHCRQSHMPLPLDVSGGKSNLQGMGSSASFGQRYVTKFLLNLVFEDEDDDGQLGGAERPISDDQLLELEDLIQRTDSDLGRLLKKVFKDGSVHRLEEVAARDFTLVKNALLQKQAKLQEKETP